MAHDAYLISADATDRLLAALGEQLGLLGERYDLVVTAGRTPGRRGTRRIGGSALLALGLVSRATRDVDVVALASADGLIPAEPLPGPLAEACARVARDFDLPSDWLNNEPAGMLRLGLPQGFVSRLERREYGRFLTVRFASRLDQIHFKLYALADRGGGGKHEADLRALQPTRDELIAAARWTRTHDPSEGHREILTDALAYLGVKDADLGP